MKKLSLILFLFPCLLYANNIASNQNEILQLKSNVIQLNHQITLLKKSNERQKQMCRMLQKDIDSVKELSTDNQNLIRKISTEICDSLKSTNELVISNKASSDKLIASKTNIGIICFIVILLSFCAIYIVFKKKYDKGSSTLDVIKKTQDDLSTAQAHLQEESVKLDNQLLEILTKQIDEHQSSATNVVSDEKDNQEPDHSLVKKVADEIMQIEVNMYHMDKDIKGYKQLAKAVQRIKDNFLASGYEIVDMLGKPYDEGMKVVANFVPDETLKEGEHSWATISPFRWLAPT